MSSPQMKSGSSLHGLTGLMNPIQTQAYQEGVKMLIKFCFPRTNFIFFRNLFYKNVKAKIESNFKNLLRNP